MIAENVTNLAGEFREHKSQGKKLGFLKARLLDATKTGDHATCVKIALCKRAYCDMRLSQESWMISTFLRKHATVTCRTNKPVYTARFCCASHQFCRIACKRTFKHFSPT